MMKEMTIANICKACGGELHFANESISEASCVVIDSRKIEAGGVFIATVGEKVDGHEFIPQVFEKGALAAVCEKLPDKAYGPCILVQDSFAALTRIAAFYRAQLHCRIVGITGSVGKTSTKEMTASVLRQRYKVCATEGNYNNEIGVPLTLLRIRDEDECAVVEMGINHFGEMSRLTALVRPDIAVISCIGECHLEALGDRDGVLKAKSEIFSGLSEDGVAILNGDDDKLVTIKEVKGKAPVFYSLAKADISFPEEMPRHMRLNALAAAAVGKQFGLGREEIEKGIAQAPVVSGRGRILDCGEFCLIDDCYNANPTSVRAAIDMLCERFPSGRTAILGDMFELGPTEKELHASVGAYAKKQGVERLIAVGALSKAMAEAFGEAEYYKSTEDLLKALPGMDLSGQNVLVKASNGMHLEKVVDYLRGKENA